MTVHCAKCGHQWELPLRLPMPIDRDVRAMKGFVAAGCPVCGSHGASVICGPNSETPDAAGVSNE